jgi:3-oxoacyl-[acyl-carrier protein] reductase
MLPLNDKKALVTGASGEIGAEIARKLHKQGCEVCLSGTRRDLLENLASELKTKVHIICSDLSIVDNAKILIESAVRKMNGVDILINNAGLTKDNLFVRMSDDEWSSVLNVNLNSNMALIKGVLKLMMKARWGRVINITSVVGFTGNPGQANYAASKAGVIGMSKSIAQEVASRGITINCIAPGFIKSAMTDKLNLDQKSRILKNIPMQRMGEATDIASATVFLALPDASYITGQTLHVNGGMAMI